jgi:hypothetical protein
MRQELFVVAALILGGVVVQGQGTTVYNGTVDVVKVARSLDAKFGLDEQAVKAAKQWLFNRAQERGSPSRCG